MSNATEAARLAGIAGRVGESLVEDFGGFLRCETCKRVEPLTPDEGRAYMSSGWPECHGRTMHWWTARQIRDGEVPA